MHHAVVDGHTLKKEVHALHNLEYMSRMYWVKNLSPRLCMFNFLQVGFYHQTFVNKSNLHINKYICYTFFFKGLAQEERKVLESQLIAPQTMQLDCMKSCYPFFLTNLQNLDIGAASKMEETFTTKLNPRIHPDATQRPASFHGILFGVQTVSQNNNHQFFMQLIVYSIVRPKIERMELVFHFIIHKVCMISSPAFHVLPMGTQFSGCNIWE